MKLVFICGSLEPGKDGVGDYTRRLAGALIRRGLTVTAVAYNDCHVTLVSPEVQHADTTAVPVLRLPKALPQRGKASLVRQWIKDHAADVVSLQFVPYSFHHKGLPFEFVLHLPRMGEKVASHIMFHELWVGTTGRWSKRKRLLGFVQKQIIMKMIRDVAPALITTTIDVYRHCLHPRQTQLLPLFGNIPISSTASKDAFRRAERYLTAIHFGTFSTSRQDFANQVDYLVKLSEQENKKLFFQIAGSGGPSKEGSLRYLKSITPAVEVDDAGYVDAETASRLMLSADVGVSRSDYLNWGKSGTTAAMLEHGLPVLLRGQGPASAGRPGGNDARFLFHDDSLRLPSKRPPAHQLAAVAERFHSLLETHTQ
ncbi:MAG: hypothetical protein WBA12_08845 [Catalinimonas sp.]